MKELTWKLEQVYVARDEHGAIIRVSDTDPETWLEEYKKEAVRPKASDATEQPSEAAAV